MPLQVKRTTREAPRYMYIPTPTLCPKLPLAYGYTNGLDTMRAVHKYNQGAFTAALFLTCILKFFQDFRTSKPSVVNAFQYVLSLTRHIHRGWWREQRCEISANSAKKQELAPKCRKFAYNAYTLPPVFLTLYRNK